MGKSFDIGLERLTGMGVPGIGETQEGGVKPPLQDVGATGATFYLETFGCQMNDHDSEKVAGVLLARGYRQVDGPEAAKVILYNTCSIREKAAQKVFSRLGELRPVDEQERKWIEEGRLELRGADPKSRVTVGEGSEPQSGGVRTRRLQSAGKIIGVLG